MLDFHIGAPKTLEAFIFDTLVPRSWFLECVTKRIIRLTLRTSSQGLFSSRVYMSDFHVVFVGHGSTLKRNDSLFV